jgi:TRAP-type mannitol/chloroaromatic compound transport system permease small subunit
VLKAAILIYAGLLALQGVALILRALSALLGDREALASFPSHKG